jgi:hypothetical protein
MNVHDLAVGGLEVTDDGRSSRKLRNATHRGDAQTEKSVVKRAPELAHLSKVIAFGSLTTFAALAHAQVAEPSPREDDAFDVMNLLAERGWHDLRQERWNAYGQFTHISSWKLPFDARYTNRNGSPNSLTTGSEHSFTTTATLYAGVALWPHAELHWVPEVISLRALSELKGLGGAIQNFELQKSGSMAPTPYTSRILLRQSIPLGGQRMLQASNPMQLGSETTSRRLVFTVGKFSVLDVFDKNAFSGDLRRQFFNMAFLAYSSFDFAADARGYAWGGAVEYYHDDWAIRFARVTPPKRPNQLELDFEIHKHYGDQLEIEHNHELFGQPGVVRILGYRNREIMGRFDEALEAHATDESRNAAACPSFNYGSTNDRAPDLCWVRRSNYKVGFGLNVEQRITRDLGVFARGMYSDGRTEVYSYLSSDRSLSFGALTRGTPWGRAQDLFGVGCGVGWISDSHAKYLRAGGIDGFIGDGGLTRGTERVIEAFYSLNVYGPSWLSADVQRISNPAYNIDRGPVTLLSGRIHSEF